jgi:hypothetical protein
MSLTLGEASRQSGFAKSSLSKAIGNGRLSAVRLENLRAAAARIGGRDGRILAARVEPKNAPQESEKTDNFKPLVFRQFQPGVDRRGRAGAFGVLAQA